MKRLFVLFAIILFSFSSYAQDSGDAKSAIKENSEIMHEAMKNGDYEKFSSFFAEDVMFKMSGHQPISGRAAVTEAHKPMAQQEMQLVINTEEVQDFGDYAHEIGNYEIHTKDGQKVDHGHYSTLWKKIDGEWKIYRDVISTSVSAK
ncbi:hypothetical protein GCM10023115_46590 [Pontixanthobacter gangjinensis]|uniref:Nuclear transport factor 2 family protein n=1 Tax=Christiangramia aestuarii TaxID=1028746 RepID=A0A7M3SXB8_9FLAO|nr:nuclear transport factor 2 family protein [Christiangramia aestuarii]MUP41249.1 nuclear transport factor 2 family protein [Christiangramia aestuarii]